MYQNIQKSEYTLRRKYAINLSWFDIPLQVCFDIISLNGTLSTAIMRKESYHLLAGINLDVKCHSTVVIRTETSSLNLICCPVPSIILLAGTMEFYNMSSIILNFENENNLTFSIWFAIITLSTMVNTENKQGSN